MPAVGENGARRSYWSGSHRQGRRHRARKDIVVSVDALLNISDSARQAFGAFDWSEHAGKGVRLFVQGFG